LQLVPCTRKGELLVGGAALILMLALVALLLAGPHDNDGKAISTPTVADEVPVTPMNLRFGAANNSPRIGPDRTPGRRGRPG
jgi:hypothetical protein